MLRLDVTDATSIADAVQTITDHGRGLDILVNNAGAGYTMPLLESDLDRAMEVYEVNVWGPLRLIQACSELLIASKGRIINMSSAGAAVNTPWIGVFTLLIYSPLHILSSRQIRKSRLQLNYEQLSGVYSSSKAAVVQMSETLRLELAPWGVSVVSIMAGTVSTAFHANEPEVILLPTSRYAAARQIISDFATGKDSLRRCSAADFAAEIVDDVLGSAGGVVWRGPYTAIVRFLSRWCPAVILVRYPLVLLWSRCVSFMWSGEMLTGF